MESWEFGGVVSCGDWYDGCVEILLGVDVWFWDNIGGWFLVVGVRVFVFEERDFGVF